MKKSVLSAVLFTLIFCASLQAQTKDLTFNQVLLVTSQQSVPANKVWKVEGVAGPMVKQYMYRSRSDADFNPPQCLIKINGNDISVLNTLGAGAGHGSGDAGGSSGFAYAGSPTNFPIWLPAGATLEASTNITYVSVIEFNVVP